MFCSYFFIKVRHFPCVHSKSSTDRRKNAFTLLEMVLCLALTGILASALTVCMHQIATFIGFASETARQCREFRSFCEILTADCERLASHWEQQALEFQFPSQENEELSWVLFKQVTKGWKHSVANTQKANHAILCAIQYRFRDGGISRHLWDTQKIPVSFTGSLGLNTLSQDTAIVSQHLLSNVDQFKLYPIDVLGRRQESWLRDVSVGLECLVIFRSRQRQLPPTFHARIPLAPRMEHQNESHFSDNL